MLIPPNKPGNLWECGVLEWGQQNTGNNEIKLQPK